MCLPIQPWANRKDRSSLAITSTTSSSLSPSRLSPSLSTLSQNGSPTSSSPSSSSSSSSSPKSCALRVVRKWSEANPAQPGQQQPKHFCSPERERECITKNPTTNKKRKEDVLPLVWGRKKALALQHRPSKPVDSRSPTFCSEFHFWSSD